MIDIIYRYDPNAEVRCSSPATPSEASQRLCKGNREFASVLDLPPGQSQVTRIIPFEMRAVGMSDEDGVAPCQQPFAIVLGCSDARVPIEMIFDQACNDLFVVRVAGNVLGSECLGSIDYAIRNLGQSLKLIVVLGHNGCGAVTAAVDAYLEPTRYLSIAASHHLRSIVDRIFVAVRASSQALESVHGPGVSRRKGYRAALIETAVVLNAALTAKTLKREFQDSVSTGIGIAYSIYHLGTREVNLPINDGPDISATLFEPPSSEKEFGDIGVQLASCHAIAHLLESK